MKTAEELAQEAVRELEQVLANCEQQFDCKLGGDGPASAALVPAQLPALDNHVLVVKQLHGESEDQAGARSRLEPTVQAARTSRAFDRKQDALQINAVVDELAKHVVEVQSGDLSRPEAILMGQAQALDTMFHQLAQLAGRKMDTSLDATEQCLRMALKAQSQCRTTLETLAEIKNPRQAHFIKQQNIAHQQQVNNGVTAASGKASRGKRGQSKAAKQTIEGPDGERLDP